MCACVAQMCLLVCMCMRVRVCVQEGNTPLHVAGRGGQPELVAQLLAAGADHTAANAVRVSSHPMSCCYVMRASLMHMRVRASQGTRRGGTWAWQPQPGQPPAHSRRPAPPINWAPGH